MNTNFVSRVAAEVEEIKVAGLYKNERIITSEQGAKIKVNGKSVLNFCANNYLGLSSHPKVIEAAKKYIDTKEVTGLAVYVLFAAHRIFIKSLKNKISKFFRHRGSFYYMWLVLMQMVVYLNLCLAKKMQLFLMH